VKLTSYFTRVLYTRNLQNTIEKHLLQKKVVIVYGARRVGKTTLMHQILESHPGGKYINCDLLQYKTALETTNSELLKDFIGGTELLILDEAQQIRDIGAVLKIINDQFPGVRVLATGSSSFELADKASEPLTGRSRIHELYPLSITEIGQKYNKAEINAKLENILRFGLYPEVFDTPEQEAIEELQNITSNYLYKDILRIESIKRPDLVHGLLKALALQLGGECSYNELALSLGENVHTIKRYIEILEHSFVIFRLPSFSRNLRKELTRRNKIYFFDLGIRNSLLLNYNTLDLRNDTGALWENFCIVERIKSNQERRRYVNRYFWRTYDQKEIDYVEEHGGVLHAFEFKWNPIRKSKLPSEFITTYPQSSGRIISRENFWELL
jgi:predicted AAA+ superfamily ATPase